MSGKDGQGNLKQCRANWSNRLAWIVVIVSGILGVAISEGAVVASPDMRSRHTSTDPARSKPLDSYQEGAEKQPSQCTANFDYPGEANLADLEITSASHRALLTAEGKPAHKLSSVLQHMIPHKSFLEVPVPYASPQVAPTSNPSIPSPSAGLQVASPYAMPSTPLFSPSSSQPTISPVAPAPTPASTSVQMPTPSPQSLPLPSITAVPVTTLSPTPGITTPARSTAASPTTASPTTASPATAASPTTLTASPAAPASPVTSAPVVSPSTASSSPTSDPNGPAVPSSTPAAVSSPATSDTTLPTATGTPSSPAATATSTLTASPATTIPAVSSSGASSPGASSPGASSSGASSSAASRSGASRSGASSSAPASQLQFLPIPFGFEPLVTAQATFLAIPASSLTLLQVAEVAADLQQALANVTNGSIPVTAVVTPINAVAAAPAPLPGRRHLLQTGNTLQATVLFTATFATAPGSNTAVSSAVQAAVATAVAPLTVATSATSIGSGSYNVTIVFPANNQVSSSASQGTLAATTFLAGLRSSPNTQLASLAASQGPFTVSSSHIQDNLVTLSPGSVSPAPAASPVLASPSPASESTPAATAPAAAAMTTPSLPADAAPVAETTPNAASTPVPTSTGGATPASAAPTPTEATARASQPPSAPPTSVTPSATPEPTSEALAPTAASPMTTPDPAEAAPQATPPSPLLLMNLSVAFPPTATAAAQDLASMLFNQSQRDFYAVVAKNGPIVFSNVMYGSQPIPIPSIAPAPAPGPDTMASSAAAAAAAPESAPSSGAAIESYSGPDADDSSSAASGQLYAINMQYGVGGARTNAVANLLVFSSNSSGPPSATDFAVQLGTPAQTGNVSVLSTYSSSSDYLIRVDCPEGYTGPVTVGYASPVIQAVNYNVIDSALLVKVTASTATQQ